MRQVLNSMVFGGIAVGLHIAAFAIRPPQGGAEAAGEGGQQLLSVAAASASYAAMAKAWETPPQVMQMPQSVMPVAPAMPGVPALLPMTDSTPGAPAPRMLLADRATPKAPTLETRSAQPPAKPPAAPSQPSSPTRQKKAAGAGAGQAAGERSNARSATATPERQRSLMAQWGGAIRAGIDRAKRPPRGAGEGMVTLSVQVMADGQLHAVKVRTSSGNPALDIAALEAVKRAKRFPPAPSGLGGGSFGFTLKIRFSG